MILISLTLENFRQYYGVQTIKFASGEGRNITVIHGENGEGKTAFLNAIKWCFYGFTNLRYPDKLLNERAEAEMPDGGSAYVRVTADFENQNCVYTVMREQLLRKSQSDIKVFENNFYISYTDEAGAAVRATNPEHVIRSILPEKMHEYFFFDGEKMDVLSKKEGSKEIKSAIKSIMGLEIIEYALEDLKSARDIFKKDAADKTQKNEAEKLYASLESDREDLELLREREEVLSVERDKILTEKEEVYKRLSENEGARAFQFQRETLENEIKSVRKTLQDINNEISSLISQKGYLAFTQKLDMKFKEISREDKNSSVLPPAFIKMLSQSLIESGKCICGRSLCEETTEYETVLSLNKNMEEPEDKGISQRLMAEMGNITIQKEDFFKNFIRLKNWKADNLERMARMSQELGQVEEKLDARNVEDIKELEDRRRSLEEDLGERIKKLALTEAEIKRKEDLIKKNENAINRMVERNKKADIAKKRFDAAVKAIMAMEDYLDASTKVVHEKLDTTLKHVYDSFSRKGYIAVLDNDFALSVVKPYDDDMRPAALSQGEGQVASPCFIGSLVKIAYEHIKSDSLYFKGGEFPIVMDSPFGTLDDEHKEQVGKGMPTLARQIVILVSKAQWTGEIEKYILPAAGYRYTLINHNPKNNPDFKYEYTLIEEVKQQNKKGEVKNVRKNNKG